MKTLVLVCAIAIIAAIYIGPLRQNSFARWQDAHKKLNDDLQQTIHESLTCMDKTKDLSREEQLRQCKPSADRWLELQDKYQNDTFSGSRR